MSGPPPKPKAQRRRTNTPARGEWVTLPPLEEPILPASLPRRPAGSTPWHPRTKAAWALWRLDPATSQFGPADMAAVIDLAYLHDLACRGEIRQGEVRLWQDRLGLSAKGKRDLRWRVEGAPEDPRAPSPGGDGPANVVDIRTRVRPI